MKKLIKLALSLSIIIPLLLISAQSYAGKFYSIEGVAIEGYDPVSYFTENKAQVGNIEFSYEWHNVTWHFTSKVHLQLFIKSPEKYVPQFGGYCALGAAHNGAVPTDPEIFTLHKGKLYLNMAPPVGVTWRLNPDFHIKRASKAWSSGKIDFY